MLKNLTRSVYKGLAFIITGIILIAASMWPFQQFFTVIVIDVPDLIMFWFGVVCIFGGFGGICNAVAISNRNGRPIRRH